MVKKFKLEDVNFCFLTYSNCPLDFDPQLIIDAVTGAGAVYRLGREEHQNGVPHFHCFVWWQSGPFSHHDAGQLFFVGGRRANIKRCEANPGRRWDYVGKHAGKKEGHYIIGDQCERPGGDQVPAQRSESDRWGEIIAAETREEFWEKLAALAPKQLGCNYGSLKLYAEDHYRQDAAEYVSPEGTWRLPEILAEWADDYASGGYTGR